MKLRGCLPYLGILQHHHLAPLPINKRGAYTNTTAHEGERVGLRVGLSNKSATMLFTAQILQLLRAAFGNPCRHTAGGMHAHANHVERGRGNGEAR